MHPLPGFAGGKSHRTRGLDCRSPGKGITSLNEVGQSVRVQVNMRAQAMFSPRMYAPVFGRSWNKLKITNIQTHLLTGACH